MHYCARVSCNVTMFILSILLISVSVCFATNCYELQQSQISSLNDRMSQMINTFYTPLPQNPVPSAPAAPPGEYNNPYYPYPYPPPQNVMYGPPPAFYPPPPPVPITPAVKPPTYYNVDPWEYNWARYYESYPQYYEYARSSMYNPFVPPSQMPPPPYPMPLVPPPPSPYVTPCCSSLPTPAYPPWEYVPYSPEYARHDYASPSPIPAYAFPTPLSPPPEPFPQLYHRHTEGSPPYVY